MEEKNNKNQTLVIIGLLALVLVLFVGIKMIFGFLEDTLPEPAVVAPAASQQLPAQETDGPNFCPHCGQELFEGFDWGQYCPDCGKQITNGGA